MSRGSCAIWSDCGAFELSESLRSPCQFRIRPTPDERREDWESFRDLFQALIHADARLSDIAKFFYLKTLVQGDAKAALETLKLTDTNYASAWRLLQFRYEHRRLLVQDNLTALRGLRPLREETSSGLRGLLDNLSRHRDQLRALGRPVESWDDWFISIATSCMDCTTRRSWEDELEKRCLRPLDVTAPLGKSTRVEGDMATFSQLAEFIQRRCNMISCFEAATPANPTSHTHRSDQGFRCLAT